MNRRHLKAYHDATTEMLDIGRYQNPIAVSLNLKKAIWPQPYNGIKFDKDWHLTGNISYFLNIINRKLLSRGENHRGLRLGTCFAYELGEFDKRPHLHGVIECPHADLIDSVKQIVIDAWAKTPWGYRHNEIKPCDKEWAEYMLKLRTKSNFEEAVLFDFWQLPLIDQHRA